MTVHTKYTIKDLLDMIVTVPNHTIPNQK
jgi:hypothetical protein